VLNPTRSKGLEFDFVVAYGFGQNCGEKSIEEIIRDEEYLKDQDKALPYQYFINRLYVAVSRAKKQLIIIDSDKGRENLWPFSAKPELQKMFLEKYKDKKSIWEKSIAFLEEGNCQHIKEAKAFDQILNAQQLERKGTDNEDPDLLRFAAVAYKNAGDECKYYYCNAVAYQLEEKYEEAGDMFLKSKDRPKEAIEAFWSAKKAGWIKITKMITDYPEVKKELEYIFSEYMVSDQNPENAQKVLKVLANHFANDQKDKILKSLDVWQYAVDEIIAKFIKQTINWPSVEKWREINECVEKLTTGGMTLNAANMGFIASEAKNYKKAVEIFEKADATENTIYRKAKAEVEPYPKCLELFAGLANWKRVYDEYQNNKSFALNEDGNTVVFNACMALDKFDDACEIAFKAKTKNYFIQLMNKAKSNRLKELNEKITKPYITLIVENNDWKNLREVIEGESYQNTKCALTVAGAIARSQTIMNIQRDGKTNSLTLNQLSEYLRTYFIGTDLKYSEETLLEIGTAVEKAQKHNDGLAYYEILIKGAYSKDLVRKARLRWIKCKERQLKYFATHHDERKAQDIQNEIDGEKNRLGLMTDDKIQEYETLSTLDEYYQEYVAGIKNEELPLKPKPPVAVPEPKSPGSQASSGLVDKKPNLVPIKELDRLSVVEIKPYTFKYYQNKNRINIENADDGSIVVIHINEQKISSEEAPFIKIDNIFVSEILPFTVRFGNDEQNNEVFISFEGKRLVVNFK